MDRTSIEWTDATYNPWIGCTKVSRGCDHCYAERIDARMRWSEGWGPRKRRYLTAPSSADVVRRLHRQGLAAAAAGSEWRPRVFCGSMCDVFDQEVAVLHLKALFELIRECDHVQWLLLTKRPKAALWWFDRTRFEARDWPHVWLGISVEDQRAWDQRKAPFLDSPVAHRFISAEPLLGGLQLELSSRRKLIHWVIAGGESGKEESIRLTRREWALALRHEAAAAGVPFFWKQWGAWAPVSELPSAAAARIRTAHYEGGELYARASSKRRAGALLEAELVRELPASMSHQRPSRTTSADEPGTEVPLLL